MQRRWIIVIAGLAALAGVTLLTMADERPARATSGPVGDPARPGGDATARLRSFNRNAFSAPSGNVGFAGELEFKIGNAVFRKLWVSSPASTRSSDGLGPLFNARSCQRCHLKDGRGHPPASPDDDAVSMFLRLSIPPRTDDERALLATNRVNVIPEPTYGGQLQDLAIQGHSAEGRMVISYEEVPVTLTDGTIVSLRRPTYAVANAAYGPLADDVMLSPRVAPQMIGLGLLDAIPEADIRALADPDDEDGDGISGRPNEVWSIADGKVALGRFGWKAGNPTVAQQSAEAFAGDMGLSTSMIAAVSGDCTGGQPLCLDAPNGVDANGAPEVRDELMTRLVFYASNLGVPPRRNMDAPDVVAGETLFHDAGCAACHTPSHVTGPSPSDSDHLAGQVIFPYTDLLLHDMGDGLADGRPEGVATGREWRTPPLWGIGLTETVSGHTFFLHDGRARNLTEAILWHGGEAQRARDAFAAMAEDDRARLIAFVESL